MEKGPLREWDRVYTFCTLLVDLGRHMRTMKSITKMSVMSCSGICQHQLHVASQMTFKSFGEQMVAIYLVTSSDSSCLTVDVSSVNASQVILFSE